MLVVACLVTSGSLFSFACYTACVSVESWTSTLRGSIAQKFNATTAPLGQSVAGLNLDVQHIEPMSICEIMRQTQYRMDSDIRSATFEPTMRPPSCRSLNTQLHRIDSRTVYGRQSPRGLAISVVLVVRQTSKDH